MADELAQKSPSQAPPIERRHAARTETSEFVELLKARERGKLKVYIGSAAGVGKTVRMLQEAHDLRRRGIDVIVGFVETHGRVETGSYIGDLEVIPRREIRYRGVILEEMDVDAVISRAPAVSIVDELAHTNVPGSRNQKRWEDVQLLLDEGISVITAVNIQHIESLNDIIAGTIGVTVRETVPDWVVTDADQVVNLDISAEDLRQRLIEGKIYTPEKIQTALTNFFTEENLSTLRELALREVASNVDRLRESITARESPGRDDQRRTPRAVRTVDRIMVALPSRLPLTEELLRKASRIAGRLNMDWYCVYVQIPEERADRIDATVQRKLVDNIQKAQSMGADVVKLEGTDVAATLLQFAAERGVTLIVAGQSRRSWWQHITRGSVIDKLVNNAGDIDVLVVSFSEQQPNGARE
ncbi:MAG TPA: universal stress protein [Gemmatimonadaceae bacterium]|nr:universal stress protein [Gemmatimonadaceae bacterium]